MSERPFTDEIDAVTVAAIDARCHKVIRAAARRHGWEAVEDHTPVHELVAREESDTTLSDEMRQRQEHFRAFLGWLFGDGPHPVAVMKRAFSLAYQLDPQLIAYMTMADLGMMFGDQKQNWSWRIKKLFEGQLRSRSQKREGSGASYAAAARGNKSRRKGERRKKREAEQL